MERARSSQRAGVDDDDAACIKNKYKKKISLLSLSPYSPVELCIFCIAIGNLRTEDFKVGTRLEIEEKTHKKGEEEEEKKDFFFSTVWIKRREERKRRPYVRTFIRVCTIIDGLGTGRFICLFGRCCCNNNTHTLT